MVDIKNLLEKSLWEEFYQDFVKECKELYENKGFTYDIPGEEQIRSALYSFLRKKGHLIELESDLFQKETKKVVGEYDLRIINNDFDMLLEIKRAWGLKNGWMNKYTEFLRSWEKDIEKLGKLDKKENYESKNINEKRKKCFVLMTFFDEDRFYEKLKKKIDVFSQSHTEWQLLNFEPHKLDNNDMFCNLFVWIEK